MPSFNTENAGCETMESRAEEKNSNLWALFELLRYLDIHLGLDDGEAWKIITVERSRTIWAHHSHLEYPIFLFLKRRIVPMMPIIIYIMVVLNEADVEDEAKRAYPLQLWSMTKLARVVFCDLSRRSFFLVDPNMSKGKLLVWVRTLRNYGGWRYPDIDASCPINGTKS